MSFVEKLKKVGKSVVDSGAKTMLKTDIVFLEREIKGRKQQFGVEVYELMEQLEVDTGMPIAEKEAKIRSSFDAARKDIAVVQAKIECKREEMQVMEHEQAAAAAGVATATATATAGKPSASAGTVAQHHVITTGHPDDDMEMEHGNL